MKFKIIFITPYPLNQAPSQRFRFEQYFNALVKGGIKYDAHSFLTQKGFNKLYSSGALGLLPIFLIGFVRRTIHLFKCFNVDFVFIHREVTPIGAPVFEWIIAKVLRKKIIYDFDDAIWLDDPDETGTLKSKLKWKGKVAKICKWSWKVNVGNLFLADYAKQFNNNVSIIPSVVDTDNVHNPTIFSKSHFDMVTVGWTGTHSTLQYLNGIIPVLQKIEKKNKINILIIANRSPNLPLQSLLYKPWSKQTEVQDLMAIDIGIMPLSDDRWSQGKGGFKIIQYLSLGIPALASPVGINNELIREGETGYLCSNLDEWENRLQNLIDSASERKRLGTNGRKFIIDNYSVKATEGKFLSLFQ